MEKCPSIKRKKFFFFVNTKTYSAMLRKKILKLRQVRSLLSFSRHFLLIYNHALTFWVWRSSVREFIIIHSKTIRGFAPIKPMHAKHGYISTHDNQNNAWVRVKVLQNVQTRNSRQNMLWHWDAHEVIAWLPWKR